jgi:hypothetical protein
MAANGERATFIGKAPASTRTVVLGARQSADQVEAWVRQSGVPGGIVVVMQLQRKIREYFLDEIAGLDLEKQRLRLTRHGRFNLAGRSIDAPRNVLSLCVPTVDLLDAAASGRTWLDAKLVFRRVLSLQEKHLVGLVSRVAP